MSEKLNLHHLDIVAEVHGNLGMEIKRLDVVQAFPSTLGRVLLDGAKADLQAAISKLEALHLVAREANER